MESTSLLPDILRAIAMQSLAHLVCLAGCIAVIVRWRSLRSAAVPALLGFVFLLLLSVLSPAFWKVFPRMLQEKSPADISSLVMIVSFVQSALWSLAMGLVILGVVLGRSPSAARNAPPQLR